MHRSNLLWFVLAFTALAMADTARLAAQTQNCATCKPKKWTDTTGHELFSNSNGDHPHVCFGDNDDTPPISFTATERAGIRDAVQNGWDIRGASR